MILALLVALQAPLAVAPDTIHPPHHAVHYDVTLVLGDTGRYILGQVSTTWLIRSAEPIQIELDSAMRVIRLQDDENSGRRDDHTLYAREQSDIILPHHKSPGDTLVSSLRYHGQVRDGLIITTNPYGDRVIFADNWPDRAHLWLPVQDHPSDKATVDFAVEVPAGMAVIANGVLTKVDTLAYGRRVWRYSMRQRIPAYGMVIGAGPLITTPLGTAACSIKCVPVAAVTYPQDSGWAVSGPFHRAVDMVEFLSQLAGPFPYDRLSHVESTTIFGGMENPSAIFFPDKAYTRKTLTEETVAHETAHQWFGDAVTERDWHHLWLSEGFATYFAALWLRHADGDSAFHASMNRGAAAVFRDTASTNRPIIDPAATDLIGLLNTNNYPKGAWVLQSLRGLIGDSAFYAGIRDYYREFRDSTALSADFAEVMSKAAGKSLDWFFTQALTQPGYPQLEVSWTQRKKNLDLVIRQTQPAEWGVFQLPNLEIGVDGVVHSVNVTGRETRVSIAGVAKPPTTVVVDPNGWWLFQSTVKGAK
jgi:aminopeptidase N